MRRPAAAGIIALTMMVAVLSAGFAASASAAPPPDDFAVTVERQGVCVPHVRLSWTIPTAVPPVQTVSVAYNTTGPSPDPNMGALWLNVRPPEVSTNTITLEKSAMVWFYARATNADGSSAWRFVKEMAPLAAGDGMNCPVANDAPRDAVAVIKDFGLENAPIAFVSGTAIFLVGLTFYLIRRGLAKSRGAMRL